MKTMNYLRPLLVAAILSYSLPAYGSEIGVAVARSRVLDMPSAIVKVSVADPTIADVAVPTKGSVLINGKRTGTTSLIVWTAKKRYLYDLVVRGDAEVPKVDANKPVDVHLLKTLLKRTLSSDDIAVEAVGDRIVLSGNLPSSFQIETAGKVAGGFAQNVVNLIQALPAPQVQVDVQVVEVRRDNGHDTGVNWGSLRMLPNGEAIFLKDLMTFSETAPGNTVTFRQFDRLAAQLKLLVSEGLAKVLATPKLVAASGGKASFLVGGQIPIPQAQQLGVVTVTWKDYGVKLDVEPRVQADGRIALRVTPEVSALDYNNAILLNGFTIPSLSTRQAQTEVVLGSGESLAIGGLLQNSETQNINKFPILGDIPILGELFKSTQFQKRETELTILVTPRMVRPTAQAATSTGGKK